MPRTSTTHLGSAGEPAAVDVLLTSGQVARIRPPAGSDRSRLTALFEQATDESIRLRFFTLNRDAGSEYVDHLLSAAPTAVIALVAEVGDALVGLASAEQIDPGSAEVSFLVADSVHGRGLGTLLLEHLAAAAREKGVRRFTAEVLVDNTMMLKVLRDAGFDVKGHTSYGVESLEMSTAATAVAVAAADARECAAEVRSLQPLLYPRTVAVVGARREAGGVGRAVLQGIRSGGFTGDLLVVHPTAAQIDGFATYASFGAIPQSVDLAVIAVPASQVPRVLMDAAKAGVSAAVVLSAGFAEVGVHGRETQRELVKIARRHSMRIVGPNCLGVMCNDPTIRLNATFTRDLPPHGRLAVASQSGGVGIALLDIARSTGLGVASFVSLGNKADVSGNDLLAAWMNDDRVGAAALYLESFGNALKFARLARQFAERKPLLAIVGGRSSGGRRAGASHTASAAAPSVGVDALFAQAGVIGCRSIDTLADTARLLAEQPLPRGRRLGVVGNAGGLGVLAADSATSQGLAVPELSDRLRAHMASHVSGTVSISNPIDLGAAASAAELVACLSAMLNSDEVDAVLAVVAATVVNDPSSMLRAIADVRAVKPLLVVFLGDVTVPENPDGAFTTFRSVEAATEALAHAAEYDAWLHAPRGELRPFDDVAATRARRVAQRALAATPMSNGGWASAEDAREILDSYGVTAPIGRLVHSPDEAVHAAEQIGFPVVAKVAVPAVVHKTERHLVKTGLRSAGDVRETVSKFLVELGADSVPVLVQPDLSGGVEIALGIVRDIGFGPLVMVAAGGIATEAWDDKVFLLPPLTDVDASRALRSLRVFPMLTGYRGSDPVDLADLQRLILAVGQLALDVPETSEMDLNPVITTSNGAACVDVKIRLSPVTMPTDAGIPRRLRSPD